MISRLITTGKVAFLVLIMLLGGSACGERSNSPTGEAIDQDFAPGRIKLYVAEDGVYRVTAGELTANGLDLGEKLTQDSIRLSDGAETVPYLLQDDALIFYGQASDNRYYAERPYILEIGEPGRIMAQSVLAAVDGPQLEHVNQSLHLEENHNYISEARQPEGSDVWFWSKFSQQDTFTTEFMLPFAADSAATLRFNALGVTHNPEVENDHDFEVLINNTNAGTAAFDGQAYHTGELSVPENTLQSGINTITLDNRAEGASFLDIVQLNWLELDYLAPPSAINDRLDFTAADGRVTVSGLSGSPAVIDISDPAKPARLEGWQYDSGQVDLAVIDGQHITVAGPRGFLSPRIEQVVESGWMDSAHQADLLIVTTKALAPALAPLVASREAEGLGVAVVPVNEIYDEFGYGAPSPESIREFVSYAFQNWQPPQPRYMLIVGDATSDYLGHLGELPDNIVPSLMVPVQFSGETVSDSRLVDVDDDKSPDLAVGRWPVRTPQEAAELVERTLAYEEGAISERILFATDSSEPSFSRIADRLIESGSLPRDHVDQRDGPSMDEIGEMWQEGAWLAAYVGHGSIDRWGKEDIFSLDGLDELQGDSAPIVLQLTCLSGLYSHPEQTSLAEAMLLHPGGPVLTVAASSLTYSAHQEPFAEELLRQLQDTSIQRIGDAFLTAKQDLDIESSEGFREISDTFALFGDPSANISRP